MRPSLTTNVDRPRSTEAFGRGMAARERHRWKTAAFEFERAANADPSDASAWFWMAVSLDNRGDELAATTAYRRALSIGLEGPELVQAWTWLASSLSKTGHPRAAMAALVQAKVLGGYDPLGDFAGVVASVTRRCARLQRRSGDHGEVVVDGGDLTLREIELHDAEEWLAGEDDEQRRWFEFPRGSTIADVVRAMRVWKTAWAEGGPTYHWGIWRDGIELVGGVELRLRTDNRTNLSYWVVPSARRAGVATRAARLASTWAIDVLGATAVVAIIDERNAASRGVARSAGFVLEGAAQPWEHGESGPMLRHVFPAPTPEGAPRVG